MDPRWGCDSSLGQSGAMVAEMHLEGGGGGVGGQMDEVITRISEHEGGAIHCCHHRANSWRLKPLQQLGDYTHTQTDTCAESIRIILTCTEKRQVVSAAINDGAASELLLCSVSVPCSPPTRQWPEIRQPFRLDENVMRT